MGRLGLGLVLGALAGCLATATATDGGQVMLTVSVGDQFAAIEPRLGRPDAEKPLHNPQPDVMGARVIEYDFTDAAVTLVRGGERRAVRSVQLVIGSGGRILRILENPNPYHGAAPRLQRGSGFLAESAAIPTDPRLRVTPR